MFNKDSYNRWRASVPFTDEQIAAKLEADAGLFRRDGNEFMASRLERRASQVRIGRVSKFDVGRVIDTLITSCAICGKKALYRSGSGGRCSTHRLVVDSYAMRRRVRLEARESDFEVNQKHYDKTSQMCERLRKSRQKNGGRNL